MEKVSHFGIDFHVFSVYPQYKFLQLIFQLMNCSGKCIFLSDTCSVSKEENAVCLEFGTHITFSGVI